MKFSTQPRLTLVHSSTDGVKASTLTTAEQTTAWQQLELFASEQPNTVVFASPDQCKLSELLALLDKTHARQILDLRNIPYLTFGGGSREQFFDALTSAQISYASLLSLGHGNDGDNLKNALKWLTVRIPKGPTMIFSDKDSNEDPDVMRANDELMQAGVKFRPIFVSLN